MVDILPGTASSSQITTLAQQSQPAVDTIYKACAYGDFEKLREFVQRDASLVNLPDEQGYYAVQWAALNNRVAVITYLSENGCNLNLVDHTGQSALHWSAVRGSLAAAETLLRGGADLNAKDCRGYTVCHVAAQYGQTALLYHIAMRWGADVDVVDNDGRTPLHWAAYKGYVDCIRLLLVMDARYGLADKEGCTPLHWAAIRGNGEACTVLLQAGSSDLLSATDVTGSTPAQLAIEKGHRYLGLYLADYRYKREGNWWGRRLGCSWLTQAQLCPCIWILILGMLATLVYQVLQNPVFPPASSALLAWSWVGILFALAGLVSLYKTTTADPGFIPTGAKGDTTRARWTQRDGSNGEKSNSYRLLDSPALWAGNWHQLCVSCKIVRPLRSKHCAVTNRCVENFDHFCPWVGNCIGKGNRHHFVVFLWLELVALVVCGVVSVLRIHAAVSQQHWNGSMRVLWAVLFVVVDFFLMISVATLAISQASQIARNVTTNELANWHRYRYLRGADNTFRNPFDKGCKENCNEAFFPAGFPRAPVMMSDGEQDMLSLHKLEQGVPH